MIVCAFLVELRLRSIRHNYRIPYVHPQFVKPFGVIFKISSPTKIVTIENDRIHSDLYPGMVVLGFEITWPGTVVILKNVPGKKALKYFEDDINSI